MAPVVAPNSEEKDANNINIGAKKTIHIFL